MTSDEAREKAEKYVEETDYINNENRRIVGNAFLAGVAQGANARQEECEELKMTIEADNDEWEAYANEIADERDRLREALETIVLQVKLGGSVSGEKHLLDIIDAHRACARAALKPRKEGS